MKHRHTRTYSLSSRAATFGSKIMADYKRVLGVMESGARNRKWTIAVCRWIIMQKRFATAKSKWVEAPANNKQLPPKQAKQNADRIQQTLNLWAFQKDEIVDFEPDQDSKRAHTADDTTVEKPPHDDINLGTSFVKSLTFSPMAASLQKRSVCPFCVYAELAGISDFHASATDENCTIWKMADTAFGEYVALVVPRPDNNAWVEASARAHNREMYSTNGNIDSVTNFEDREGLMAVKRAQLWDAPTIPAYDGPEGAVLVSKALENMPKLYYTDRTLRGTQAPTNVGTLYQYTCRREILEQALNDMRRVSGDSNDVHDDGRGLGGGLRDGPRG
jgi:hypothetical protein